MEAIEFLKEYKRMCLSNNYCVDCKFREKCIYTHRPCDIADEMFKKVIAYVETWSKAHPIITNSQKFKEVFGFNGNTVNSVKPEKGIAGTKGSCGYDDCRDSCGSRHFPRCPMWWDEPYKEPEHED